MSKLAKLNQFKRYLQNNAGSIAPIFAAAAVPFFLVAGAAIDMTRASREQVTFFNSVDGAALAIAADDRAAVTGLSATDKATRIEELKAYALTYLNANYSKDTFNPNKPTTITVDLEIDGTGVKLNADVEFPTTFMSLAGVNSINLSADSEVKFAMKPIELVMVMDTTGSMASDNKMQGAKDAARALLDKIYQGDLASKPRSEYLRLAMVPFSGSVRLNTDTNVDFDLDWIDTTGQNPLSRVHFDGSSAPSTWNNYTAWGKTKKNSSSYNTWNGCVEARMPGDKDTNKDYNANDVAPISSNGDTLFPALFSPDTPSDYTDTSVNLGTTRRPRYTTYSYGNDYITGTSTSAVGSECKGLTSTQCNSFTEADQRLKQENYRKYEDKIVSASKMSSNCAASAITPMTYDRQTFDNAITAMSPAGYTLIAEGLAWGLRAISPTVPLTKVQGSGSISATTIAPFNGPRWQKVMVLMTDGDNNVDAGGADMNLSQYMSYGYLGEGLTNNRYGTNAAADVIDNLDQAMLDTCQRIKDSGVTLYVTSFGTGVNSDTQTKLETCATSGEHYEHASTTDALSAFFDHIGQDVLSKMIYVAK
jgi:Flp pilus assembly protein TadG